MKRALWICLGILCALSSLYFAWQGQDTAEPKDTSSTADADLAPDPAELYKAVPEDFIPDKRLNRLSDGQVEFKPALEISRRIRPENPAEQNLAEIEAILGQYRFAYGENPIGVENFEFTEQLRGKNPKRIIFIADDSSALRGNELVDQWGSPYFFHPISGQEMEITSAGPDQTFWTDDDISTAP